jgi:hypothetical protein
VVAALFRTWSPYLDDLEPFPAQRTGQHYGVEKNLSMVAFPSKFVGAVLAALTVSTAALAQSYYDDQACRQFADAQVAPLRDQANSQAVGNTLLGAGLGAAVGARGWRRSRRRDRGGLRGDRRHRS